MTDPDARLRFIEQVEYRGHLMKIARRGDEIRILIYPPGASLATRIIVDDIANHVAALDAAKALIDRLRKELGFEDIFDD
jgi:hypothetical protein